MKLVTFVNNLRQERLGLLAQEKVLDLQACAKSLSLALPDNILDFLSEGEKNVELTKKVEEAFLKGRLSPEENKFQLLAPVPHPPTCRDAYAFRQHVASARKSRGLEMIPEYDQFPVFYFTNHQAIFGPGDIVVEKDHLEKLDFELEIAAVIGKRGKNIKSEDADSYIFGFTIMNDFSARLLQAEEMKLNLGPAKGKDFTTTIGPWLVSKDELKQYRTGSPAGERYNLLMSAFHNGKQVSSGNVGDMNWTFAEIIERCSYGVELLPGDIIGSGTVGTGCYLELNGTGELEAKSKGEKFDPVWLKAGDEIKLEITGLGSLSNRIVKAPGDYSILSKKKPLQSAKQ